MCQNTGYILVYSLYGNIRFRGNPYSGKFYAFPVGIYLFNVNSGNTRRICVTCSKLTLETAEQRRCRRFWYLYCQLWKYFRHCFRVFIRTFDFYLIRRDLALETFRNKFSYLNHSIITSKYKFSY